MHADNLFGGIPFDYSQIKRHSGNVERVTGSGNFTGQRRICFRLDQCARIKITAVPSTTEGSNEIQLSFCSTVTPRQRSEQFQPVPPAYTGSDISI